MLLKNIQKLGLNDKEAKTYLSILEMGEGNVGQIAKKSGITRTTTYDVVGSLAKKGIVSSTIRKGKKIYVAEDPRKMGEALEERVSKFKELLPELLSMASMFDKKPVIKFFEGEESLQEIYKDQLNYPDKEITGWWANDYNAGEVNKDWFFDYFGPKRVSKKIWVRAIMPDTKENMAFKTSAKQRLTRLKVVLPENINIPVPILMYGDKKIAIVSMPDKMGMIIESQKIHDSLKSIFEMAWQSLPDEKK